MDFTSLTLAETQKGLAAKQFSAAELTQAYLERIKALDPKLESYLFISKEEELLRQVQDGNLKGELAGIPIGHKDVFCTDGLPTTVASKVLNGYVPPFDATIVSKLKQAGAVTLGKLNTDEFVMGSSCESSAYQKTKNPWDLSRVPGGSSGGSAAAVAADLCVFATGSDTGGSIRQPASFCGVTGFKPTYGRIGRYGAIAMASSLDTVGFITKTAEDAAIVLQLTAGFDPADATSSQKSVPDYRAELKTDLKGLKIGIPKEYFVEGLNPEIEQVVRAGIAELQKLGAEILEVSLPHTEYAVPAYYIIAPSEISANLARFDGIRFGPAGAGDNLIETYFDARTKGLGDEVKRRIMLGTFALSAGYADAYYKKALRARTLIKQDFEQAFATVDLIVAPVAPTTAFRLGEKTDDPLAMYLEDIFTIPASLAGVPAISVPCGFDSSNLPIGLQILGPQWSEARVLAAAHAFQLATDWHKKKPAL
jgi:aspartyl-tRNA(Asn)/glutamyl-tRNA(Gln) amidotransferase subunit A